jgi:apolipoprotein N-acyltransferase
MPFLIALLAGAVSVLAYDPFGQFWLMLPSWGLLYALLCRREIRSGRAFLLGWGWGIGAMFAGLCWLVVALHRYGGMAGWLSVLLILLFSVALALYHGIFAAVFARLRGPLSGPLGGMRPLLAAACWVGVELLRGQLFPSFPWLLIGYTQTPPSPLAGWAPVLGVYGVSFMLALVTAALVDIVLNRTVWRRALAWVLVPCLIGLGLRGVTWSHPVGDPVSVALVQTNVAQDEKWRPELAEEWLRLNLDLVREHPAQITVLPESSLPMLEESLPEGYVDTVREIARLGGGDAILGMFTRDAQGGIYNSVVSFGKSPTQRYSKNHLVPFGEYKPYGFGWFFDLANIPMANQTPGGDHQPLLQMAGQQIAMNICYEDVFGEELRRALPQATLMVNVSNLAWYGDSHAQPQHLQMSRMRALESGRPQLRATNTGMTGIVMPDGSVAQVLAPFTRGAVLAQVRGYQGETPFVWWGDYPLKIVCAGLVLWALWQARRKSRS